MATAKAGPRRTSRVITLKLTEGEADAIMGILAQVGGHPTKSPRKYVRRVLTALKGATGYGTGETDALHLSLGHIEMFDYDDHPVIEPGDRTLAVLTSFGFQAHADHDPEFAVAQAVLEEYVSEPSPPSGVFQVAGLSGLSS